MDGQNRLFSSLCHFFGMIGQPKPQITIQRLTARTVLCKNVSVTKGDYTGNDSQEEKKA